MLYSSELYKYGSKEPGVNPFARFKSLKRNQETATDGTLTEEDKELLGYETAPRYLPYLMQDQYRRTQDWRIWPAIILENEFLKAVFLPTCGGRLLSLYDKRLKRPLVFSNSVIRPSNLAIRNAWFAGGIEWNLGQLGHSFTTYEPLFSSYMRDDNGEQFLRMYEYERCHQLFWQMDFHLPKKSPVLKVYVRIVNDRKEDSPLYWWTNCALCEEEKTRVYSCTDQVLHLNMETLQFGRGKLPELSSLPGRDASYPVNFGCSNEYFFQNPKEISSPWEAVSYPGWTFFERSSSRLLYRKMFCWGTHQGGRHWKEYLTSDRNPGENYFEIQAGLAKTQNHGKVLPAQSEIDFVQCFGGFGSFDGEDLPYAAAEQKMGAAIGQIVNEKQMEEMLLDLRRYGKRKPGRLYTMGSGYGALEALRRKKQGDTPIPDGFFFPERSMGSKEEGWKNLLKKNCFTQSSGDDPLSFMIQPEWKELLLNSYPTAAGLTALAVMQIEDGEYKDAKKSLSAAIEAAPTASAYYYLAGLSRKEGQYRNAQRAYKAALLVGTQLQQTCIYREYLGMLLERGRFLTIERIYKEMPLEIQKEERICFLHIKACLELGKLEEVVPAFSRSYIYVRENETDLSDIWITYQQKKHFAESGEQWTKEQSEEHFPVPYELDFRTCKKTAP